MTAEQAAEHVAWMVDTFGGSVKLVAPVVVEPAPAAVAATFDESESPAIEGEAD